MIKHLPTRRQSPAPIAREIGIRGSGKITSLALGQLTVVYCRKGGRVRGRRSRPILSNKLNSVELSATYINHSFLYIKATSLTCRFLTIPRRRQSTNSLIFIKERFLVLLVRVISNRSIKG